MSQTKVKTNKELNLSTDLGENIIPEGKILYVHGFAGDSFWFVSQFPQNDWKHDFALDSSDFDVVEGELIQGYETL